MSFANPNALIPEPDHGNGTSSSGQHASTGVNAHEPQPSGQNGNTHPPNSGTHQPTAEEDEEELVTDYIKKKRGQLTKQELEEMGLREATRIECCSPDDVEELWQCHPVEFSEKERDLHLKSLLRLVHPDKHPNATDAQKATLNKATAKLNATHKYVSNPPKKNINKDQNSPSHTSGKFGEEHLRFYNTVRFMECLIVLFANPENAVALKGLTELNQEIKTMNIQANKIPQTGTIREELLFFYKNAHRIITECETASEEDEPKLQEELQQIYEKSKRFCESNGLPRSFSWPSPDCTRRPIYWCKQDKERERVEDGVWSYNDFRKQAKSKDNSNAPSAGNEGPSSRPDPNGSTAPQPRQETSGPPNPDADATRQPRQNGGGGQAQQTQAVGDMQATAGQGSSLSMNPPQSSFIGFDKARAEIKTYDGKRMLAAKKIGSASWSIIVNENTEDSPWYRFRTGNECGGSKILDGIVQNLPRLGCAEKHAQQSSFRRLKGVVQLGNQVYCYVDWEEGREPTWVSRSRLSTCLKSGAMVDQMVQELGAELPLRQLDKKRLLDALATAQSYGQSLQPTAAIHGNSFAPEVAGQDAMQGLTFSTQPTTNHPQYFLGAGSQYGSIYARQTFRHRAFPAPRVFAQ